MPDQPVTRHAASAPKPRAFVLPVVKPVTPPPPRHRPSGGSTAGDSGRGGATA